MPPNFLAWTQNWKDHFGLSRCFHYLGGLRGSDRLFGRLASGAAGQISGVQHGAGESADGDGQHGTKQSGGGGT